jgi:hypothetical protein
MLRKNGSWKDSTSGYIVERYWEDGKCRRILQHRRIIQSYLGRKLETWEDVHHLDGNKSNNEISNLQVLSHGKHSCVSNIERIRKGKGVLRKIKGKYKYWLGQIKKNKQTFTTKHFHKKTDALSAYNELKKSLSEGGK